MTESELCARVKSSEDLLGADDILGARRVAQSLLQAARQTESSPAVEAQALLCLAHCDQQAGRLHRALKASRRASQLFRQFGDTAHESTALSAAAVSLSLMGHVHESFETALLAVKLAEMASPLHEQALALTKKGIALMWARDFEGAEAAYQRAIQGGLEFPAALHPAVPDCSRLIGESIRIADLRFTDGDWQSRLPPFGAQLAEALGRLSQPDEFLPHGSLRHRDVSTHMWALRALAYAWNQSIDDARYCLAQIDRHLEDRAASPHLQVARGRAQAEIAFAEGQWEAAFELALQLTELARDEDHEQYATLGHYLRVQVRRVQGNDRAAVCEMHELRAREHLVQRAALEHCRDVVQWQVDARAGESRLQEKSRVLEKLSFEDCLTGVANRRRLDAQLAMGLTHSKDPARPLCLAMLDVDRFKQINDRFTHLGGDQVLTRIASAIRSAIRDSDTVARFAGDEFVVLFPDTSLHEARVVCDRIRAQIAAIDWAYLSVDLRITVSVGLAQSEPNDTPSALLLRSDVAMFAEKGSQTMFERFE